MAGLNRAINAGSTFLRSTASFLLPHGPLLYLARVGTRRRCPIRIVVLRPMLLEAWIARTLVPYLLARPRRVSPRDTLWVA